MKDPLNNSTSPYDVLEVALDADKNAIIGAFKKALALRKYSHQQIANARKSLLDSEMRLQEDFFLYDREEEKELRLKAPAKKQDNPLLDGSGIKLIKNYDNLDTQLLQEEV